MAGVDLQGEILDEAHEFVVQLADIYDYVTPCFPEKYRIFRVIFKEYHQHMSYMLDCMGACAEQLANSDILKARQLLLPRAWPITLAVFNTASSSVFSRALGATYLGMVNMQPLHTFTPN